MVHEVARALGAECALLERHVLLGLRVEGRVFDEAVDEDLASEWQAGKHASMSGKCVRLTKPWVGSE